MSPFHSSMSGGRRNDTVVCLGLPPRLNESSWYRREFKGGAQAASIADPNARITLRVHFFGNTSAGVREPRGYSTDFPVLGYSATANMCDFMGFDPIHDRHRVWLKPFKGAIDLGAHVAFVVFRQIDYAACAPLVWKALCSSEKTCCDVVKVSPQTDIPFVTKTHGRALDKLAWPNYLPIGVGRILTLDCDTEFAFNSSLIRIWRQAFSRFEPGLTVLGAAVEPGVGVSCELKDLTVPFGFNSGVVAWDLNALRASAPLRGYRTSNTLTRVSENWWWEEVSRKTLNVLRLGDQNVFSMFARLHPDRFAVLPCQLNFGMSKLHFLLSTLRERLGSCRMRYGESCCVAKNFQCAEMPELFHWNTGIVTFDPSESATKIEAKAVVDAVRSIWSQKSDHQIEWKAECGPGRTELEKGGEECCRHGQNNSVCSVSASKIHFCPPGARNCSLAAPALHDGPVRRRGFRRKQGSI